jgi:hypothetical protein
MAVAAPARKSRAVAAPAPSRTTPPRRKAPARKLRAAPAAPARRPVRRAAPAARPKLAVVAGRTAVAVSQLPDSSLVVRMTRGRAWIAVLGVLLVGIVALNVATLSFAASSGKIDAQITALEKENTMLESRVAERFSTARVRSEATSLGLTMNAEEPKLVEVHPGDAATAAARLAVAGG